MFDVDHIAKLARLGLTEEEKQKFAKELAAILDFVKKLQEVDVMGVEPTAQVTGRQNVMRPDEAQKENDACRREILTNAPAKEKDYIKVKAVFEY